MACREFFSLTTSLTARVKEKARQLGFSLVGVTTPERPPHLHVYREWIAKSRHGEMGYLATKRAFERRAEPQTILPDSKSILVLATPYSKPQAKENAKEGRVAAYAQGKDYHDVLPKRMKALVDYIEREVGKPVPNRWYTDTGPLLERALAQRAGLGWIGKNTMLINPQAGSYFLLSEILLGVELETDQPITTDHCGTCMRCIEACPTDCILPDCTLDATRCISYLTIERKGSIEVNLRNKMGNWVFGCDICQIVCPWNERFAPEHGDLEFDTARNILLENELELDAAGFSSKFKRSPVKRTKRGGYLRNAAIALGNRKDPAHLPALAKVLLRDQEPVVRGHAAWSIGQIGGAQAHAALTAGLAQEKDNNVIKEIEAALENA